MVNRHLKVNFVSRLNHAIMMGREKQRRSDRPEYAVINRSHFRKLDRSDRRMDNRSAQRLIVGGAAGWR